MMLSSLQGESMSFLPKNIAPFGRTRCVGGVFRIALG